jgi:hypothetical protein
VRRQKKEHEREWVEEIQGLTESEARERRERGLGNDTEVRTGRSY